MSNILKGVQQALEAIRIETESADWQLRLEILQLILSTSESVVADARKQAEPEVKQVKQTVPVPKTKLVKRYVGTCPSKLILTGRSELMWMMLLD
jgi:hypothetical protein